MPKLAIILIALAALVIIPFGTLALSPNYNYCVAHNGQKAASVQDYKSASDVTGPIANPTAASLFLRCGGFYASENADALTAISTVLMTLATIFLGWLAYAQAKTTRAQLRAYLGYGPNSNFIFDPTPARKHGFRVELLNAGATPAYNIRFVGKMKVLPVINPKVNLLIVDPVEFPFGEGNGIAIVGPNRSTFGNIVIDLPVQPAELTAIFSDPARRIYVWGKCEYFDIFGVRRTFTVAESIRDIAGINWVEIAKQPMNAAIPGSVFFNQQCELGNRFD